MEFLKRQIERANKIGKKLLLQRLIDGASGNMSFRFGNHFYITKTGVMLDELDETSFVRMDVLSDNLNTMASSDQLIHREVYRKSDLKAVLHCHGVYNVVLSFKKSSIIPLDLEGRYFLGEVKVVNCRYTSRKIAEIVSKELTNNRITVVRGHGIYAAGENLDEAYRLASYLEHSCEVLCKLHNSDV